jgi:D-alanyl-D-alanine carboxypeptidase (penicillin-binding protein 5/6)
MTLLIACENLNEQDLAQSVIISADIVNRMKAEGASGIGMVAGEEFTVKDLLYAIALASDGVASEQLAIHIAGSLDAFVAMMNDKAAKLGLINTNFKNCTGLHHAQHVSTCREMASIMIAALDHELIRTLLSTHSYSTTTNVYPKGRSFSSTYNTHITETMRPIGYQTQPAGGTVIATKTGYTPEANYCLASYYERSYDHKPYVVITADAPAAYFWVVYDYLKLYEDFAR